MSNPIRPQTHHLLIVALLLAALLLGLAWFLPLTPDELSGVLILILGGGLYAFVAIRYLDPALGARSIYVTMPINVLLVTLGYALLYHALPSAWIFYFILPIGAAVAYRPLASLATGVLSSIAYLTFETSTEMLGLHPAETALNAIVLIIFSLATAILIGGARRQEQELTLLSKISQALNTVMRVDELLEITYTELKEILPVDAYFVALYEAHTDELDFAIGVDRNVRERRYRVPAREGLVGQVLQTRQPLLIHDYLAVNDALPAGETWGIGKNSRSLILVPILRQMPATPNLSSESEVLGILSIQSYKPRAYTNQDLKLLEGLTRTISYALERAHLAEQIENARIGEQAILLRLSQELLGLFDPRAVLNRAVAITHEAFQLDATHIWLLDEFGENCQLTESMGFDLLPSQEISVPLKIFSAANWAIQHRSAAVIPDIETETRFQVPPPIRQPGLASAIIAPLQVGERAIGILVIAKSQSHQWSEDENRLLSLIANQTALAYERTRLWQSFQARVQTLQIMAEASQAFASFTDLKETTRIIIESAARMMGAEHCFVSLLDPPSGRLFALRPILGITEEELALFEAQITPELVHQFHAGEIFLANDVSQLNQVQRQFNERFGIRNQLDVRMSLQNQPFGILHLRNKISGSGFTAEDTHLITTFANQAAVALQNARLYESLRESEVRYRILAEDSLLGVYLLQDNRFLYVNPALANSFGYSAEEIVNQFSPLDFVHPDDRALVADNIHRRDSGEIETTQSEFRVIRRDGSIREVESYGARIQYGGRPATLGTMLDITDRKRAQVALREREALLRRMADQTPAAFVIYGESRTLFVNRTAETLTGYTAAELYAMDFWEIMHPDFRKVVKERGLARQRGEQVIDKYQVKIVTKPGQERWLDISTGLIDYESQKAVLVTAYDITSDKQAEERLRHKVNALQTLTEIDRQITAAADQQTVLELVCQRTAELLQVPKSLIGLYLPSGKRRLAASHGLLDADLAMKEINEADFHAPSSNDTPTARVFSLADIHAGDPHLPEFRVRENIHAYAHAVLVAEGELLGSLIIFDTRPHGWTSDEIQLLDLLAGQAAIVLARTRLLEKTRTHLRETLLLNRVIAAATSSQESFAVLQIVCDDLARAFSLPQVAAILGNNNQTASVIAESRESSRPSMLGTIFPIEGNPLVAYLRSHRGPVSLSSTNPNSDFSSAVESLKQLGYNAAVFLPLVLGNRVPGTIVLFSLEPRKFTKEELDLAQNVTSAAGQAMDHAELFTHARDRLERLTTLHDIMLAVNSTSSLQERLNLLLEMTRSRLRADLGVIFLREPDTDLLRVFAHSGTRNPKFAVGFSLRFGEGGAGWIAQYDQPLAIVDVHTDSRWKNRETMQAEGLVSYIGTPLRVQNEVIGVLDFAWRTTREFANEEVEFLATLASQAAVAIQNARLFESENAERRKLELLYQVGRELTVSLDVQTIFRRAVSLATRALSGCMGEGFVYDSALSSLHLVAFARPEDVEPPDLIVRLSPNLNEGLVGWIATRREAVIANDLREDSRWVPVEGFDAQARSAIGVPLLAGDQLLGVLLIFSDKPNAFSSDQLDLMIALGNPISIALSNAQSFAQAEQRIGALAALNETSREITAQPDLPILLETIVERAMELLHAPGAGLSIYDAERRELIPAITHGYKIPEGTIVRIGDGALGHVAETRQPLIVADYHKSEYRLASFEEIPIRSLVAVPMLYRGELIGTLAVLEFGNTKRRFTEEDARWLSLFAAQAAGAIHNTRLIEELRARANQFGLLYDAGMALNSVLESNAQIEYLVKIARRALHAKRAEFYLYNPEENELHLEVGIDQTKETPARESELRFRYGDEQGIIGWIAAQKIPFNLGDLSRDARWIRFDPEVQSGLWVPVEHEQRLLGVLGVFATRLDAFSMQDERLLALFANQVAVALVNARLFAETQRRAEEAETLRQAASVVAATLQPEEAIERILVQLERVVPYDSASVQLWRAGYMEIVGGRGWHQPEKIVGLRFPIPGDNPNTRVVQMRQPLIVHNVRDEYPAFEEDVHSLVASWLGAPLVVHDAIIGMLAVDSRQPHYFTPEHLRLISAFADQVAIALENARLFAETRRRLAEQEAMNRIASALRTMDSLENTLAYFLDQVLALLDTTAGNIMLYDPASNLVNVMCGRGWFRRIMANSARTSEGISGHVIASGEPYLIHEFVSDALTRAYARPFMPKGWGGACIPIRDLDQVIGTLMIGVATPRECTPAEVSLLTTMAEILGFNIHRFQQNGTRQPSRRRTHLPDPAKRKRTRQ